MPKPKNVRDAIAWDKIIKEMTALQEAIPEYKNLPGFAEESTESLFYAFKEGRANMLSEVERLTGIMTTELKSSFQNEETSSDEAINREWAINKWEANCKDIINKELEDKPRATYDPKLHGIGSHRNADKPSPQGSKNTPDNKM